MKNQSFQALHRLHRWLGLFLSFHVLIFAITGVVLVFRAELSAGSYAQTVAAPVIPLQSLVEKSLRQFPYDRILAIGVDAADPNRVTLRLGREGSPQFRGARRLTYDRQTGEPVPAAEAGQGFLQTLLILHREMFLGNPGKLYVGTLGFLYALLLISGLILYGPLMKRVRFAELRSAVPRLWWSDLHKYGGGLTFAWSLVIGLSGCLLGWGGPLIKVYQSAALKDLQRVPTSALESPVSGNVDQALKAAEIARPQSRFSFVAFPGSEFATAGHYIFAMEGTTPLTARLSELVVVDAARGEVTRLLSLPWYLKLLLLAEPLHFGDYGGLPMKIIWVAFGLFSLVLPLSGLRLAWQKFAASRTSVRSRSPAAREWPYLWPLIFIVMSWMGLLGALGGSGDLAANSLLASVVLCGIVLFISRNRAVRPDADEGES